MERGSALVKEEHSQRLRTESNDANYIFSGAGIMGLWVSGCWTNSPSFRYYRIEAKLGTGYDSILSLILPIIRMSDS